MEIKSKRDNLKMVFCTDSPESFIKIMGTFKGNISTERKMGTANLNMNLVISILGTFKMGTEMGMGNTHSKMEMFGKGTSKLVILMDMQSKSKVM